MVVGDCGLPRIDRPASGDLVERMNGKRCGPVRRRQEVGVEAKGFSRSDDGVLIDSMRPYNLLARGHVTGEFWIGPLHSWLCLHGFGKLTTTNRHNSTARADVVLFWCQRHRFV